MTLIEAQDRYIKRVTSCHPGHANRVRKSAWTQLFRWAVGRGFSLEAAKAICKDAKDMAALEARADEWVERAFSLYCQ